MRDLADSDAAGRSARWRPSACPQRGQTLACLRGRAGRRSCRRSASGSTSVSRSPALLVEVSNWARPGGASRHNQAYWRRQATIGLGPGAHGFDGDRRRTWNAARLDGYLAALVPAGGALTPDGTDPRLPPGGVEELEEDAVRLESASLALRTREGIAAEDVSADAAQELQAAVETGLMEHSAGRLRLTARGRLLAGEIAVRLAG
jgi:oxygen-independent coproporphyrinogen-3 oxidase